MRVELWGGRPREFKTKADLSWLTSRYHEVQPATHVNYADYAALATGKIWVRI